MSIELKEKINLLANQVNLKMEIKISYIKYFKLYSNDLIDGKISRIKNNAIEQESKFWLDLYKKNVEIESLLKEFGTKNRN